MVVTILEDPAYRVPPARPGGPFGTLAWLRASVPRFCDGEEHARRRALVIERLDAIDPAALGERARTLGDHVLALAEALGASDPAAAATAVREIAPHYNPPPASPSVAATSPAAPAGVAAPADAAVSRLLGLLPASSPERAAAAICILVQACAATEALLANGGALSPPPVPVTRRIGPDGALVEVDLTPHPFGAGAHACPGARHALALLP